MTKKIPGFAKKDRDWLAANGFGDITKDVYQETWAAGLATDKGATVDIIVYKTEEQKTFAKVEMYFTDENGMVNSMYTASAKDVETAVKAALSGVKGYLGKDYGLELN